MPMLLRLWERSPAAEKGRSKVPLKSLDLRMHRHQAEMGLERSDRADQTPLPARRCHPWIPFRWTMTRAARSSGRGRDAQD